MTPTCAGVSYGELLPICAEGLREVVHPHCFVAKQMFKEMVEAPVRFLGWGAPCVVSIDLLSAPHWNRLYVRSLLSVHRAPQAM